MKLLISKYLNIPLTRVAVAALMVLMLFSCAREEEIIDGGKPNLNSDATATTFTVSAASSSKSLVATRGSIPEDGIEDNKVEDITILLFESKSPHQFVTSAYLDNTDTNTENDITKLAKSGNEPQRYKFTANLPKGSYKALFLANAKTDFIEDKYDIYGENPTHTVILGGAAMTGLTIEGIENALVRENLGKYPTVGEPEYKPFVMSSGRIDITNPNTVDYEVNPIKIARDMAKINVKFDTPEVSAKLQMKSIHLCYYNHQSYAVPKTVLWDHWKNTTLDPNDNIIDPLFDADAARSGARSPDLDAEYYETAGEIVNNECIDRIFTPEQPFANEKNLCVLIEATQVTLPDGSVHANRWYKIEFLRRKTPDAKETHINILRNYKYTINITAVGNWGYATPNEAFAHNSEGLIYEIEAMSEDNGITDIVFNGQYQLGVDKPAIEISSAANSVSSLKVHTDYDNGTSACWELDRIIFPQGDPAWLSLSPNSGGKGYTTVTLTAQQANPNVTTPRTATVVLTAGNLRKEVTVTQTAGEEVDPVLEYISGVPNDVPAEGTGPNGRTDFNIIVKTNLPQWRMVVDRINSDGSRTENIRSNLGSVDGSTNPNTTVQTSLADYIDRNDDTSSRQFEYTIIGTGFNNEEITLPVITATQLSPSNPPAPPELKYAGTTTLPNGKIGKQGGTYRIDATTNLPDGKWGVMVYINGTYSTGIRMGTPAYGSKTPSGTYSVNVNVGANNGAERRLMFYLFDASGSGLPMVVVGTWTQE